MKTVPDIERAQAVYHSIRDCWVAKGGALEAHERLSLVTVAGGFREFAFLNLIDPALQSTVAHLLRKAGLTARPCSSVFDLEFEPEGISAATVEAYKKVERESSSFSGLGVWTRAKARPICAGMMSLGRALSYPRCCERMDLLTKQKDHELFLTAIVDEESDDPGKVEQALRQKRNYSKGSYDHCNEWGERFVQTHSRFPFVLHTACDDCLRADHSPTAVLNAQYESLALSVSAELHLMVRWGARVMSYQPE